jgi:hypothetical protein
MNLVPVVRTFPDNIEIYFRQNLSQSVSLTLCVNFLSFPTVLANDVDVSI